MTKKYDTTHMTTVMDAAQLKLNDLNISVTYHIKFNTYRDGTVNPRDINIRFSVKNHNLDPVDKSVNMHIHPNINMGEIYHSFSGVGSRTQYAFADTEATTAKVVKLVRAEHKHWSEHFNSEAVRERKVKEADTRLRDAFPELAENISPSYDTAKIKDPQYTIYDHGKAGFSIEAATSKMDTDQIKAIVGILNNAPLAPEPVEDTQAMVVIRKIAKVEEMAPEEVVDIILRNTSLNTAFNMIEAETKIDSVG